MFNSILTKIVKISHRMVAYDVIVIQKNRSYTVRHSYTFSNLSYSVINRSSKSSKLLYSL